MVSSGDSIKNPMGIPARIERVFVQSCKNYISKDFSEVQWKFLLKKGFKGDSLFEPMKIS